MIDLDAIEARIRDCKTYNFGLWNADKLAHEDAPAMLTELRHLRVIASGNQGAIVNSIIERTRHETPDDEREALSEFLFTIYEHGTQPNALREADAILSFLAARRSEVPEPSADLCEWCDMPARGNADHPGHDRPRRSCGERYHGEWFEPDVETRGEEFGELQRLRDEVAAMTAEKEKWRIRCAEETIAWADEAAENRRLLAAEPQGEPSDAVSAAIAAFDGYPGDAIERSSRAWQRERMASALRAAWGVR